MDSLRGRQRGLPGHHQVNSCDVKVGSLSSGIIFEWARVPFDRLRIDRISSVSSRIVGQLQGHYRVNPLRNAIPATHILVLFAKPPQDFGRAGLEILG
jgi:hypothetical protein